VELSGRKSTKGKRRLWEKKKQSDQEGRKIRPKDEGPARGEKYGTLVDGSTKTDDKVGRTGVCWSSRVGPEVWKQKETKVG